MDLPGSKLAEGNGFVWKMASNYHLRMMTGDPGAKYLTQQVPYLHLTKGGAQLDKFGNAVPSTLPGGIPNPTLKDWFTYLYRRLQMSY